MPSPDWPESWTSIRSGPLEARFLPENGGRMTHLAHDRFGDILVPTPGPEFEPLNWPKAGGYPLFPYHNKLLGAAFTHEGQRHEVLPHPVMVTDAQHGPAHRRSWHVVSQAADRIELAVDYQADADWPFDFRAVQRFVLSNDRLDIELSMTNTGTVSIPGGFGWHPYFASGFDRTASSDARRIWPIGTAGIPDGSPAEIRTGEELPGEGFTVFLSEWHRATAVTKGGAEVIVTAGPDLPHMVAHRTSGYVCLEPVSHVAGVFGFQPDQQQTAGLFVLKPGEGRVAQLNVSIGPGPDR
ncbi:aldose 1-epimerase [Rhizobium sp. XQZ8]|uniref:aldose epimerase family protein n=1 Tax=Rhizobium populisoli TaxID=2859785 RepID=UPI001CA50B12|nr:aldose 1-epimerase [Rhizobium populisoli]MBW6425303.1 aldose 1-epimerase [Rhizobium populisoli]